MTHEELYYYMRAYQQEHEFSNKGQSNFMAMLETLKPSALKEKSYKQPHDDRETTL